MLTHSLTHVTTTVRSCFAALRQIRSVRRALPQHAVLTLIRALVISKDACCATVLVGVSGRLLDRLQSILHAAARLIFSTRRPDNISPLLYDLQVSALLADISLSSWHSTVLSCRQPSANCHRGRQTSSANLRYNVSGRSLHSAVHSWRPRVPSGRSKNVE